MFKPTNYLPARGWYTKLHTQHNGTAVGNGYCGFSYATKTNKKLRYFGICRTSTHLLFTVFSTAVVVGQISLPQASRVGKIITTEQIVQYDLLPAVM